MHWKQKRDFFYSHMTPEAALEAGFFHDSAMEDEDFLDAASLSIGCTPIHFAAEGLKRANKPAILISTGCFAPLHHGHISAMKSARAELLKNGYDAVYGYFAPDHDEYVKTKTDDSNLSIDNRIRHILKSIKESWLSVDCWGGLIAKRAVNFTDIMVRLREYILTHVGVEVPVFLVVGSDNARFAKTFTATTYFGCVIVNRPNSPVEERLNRSNIFYAQGDSIASSTACRKQKEVPQFKSKKLYLRVDESRPDEAGVAAVLAPYFKEIEVLSVQSQEIARRGNTPVISLDSLKPAEQNLAVSRLYDVFGMNRLGFIERPESKSLLEQISNIPKGHYDLWDDDIASGKTMRFVRQALSAAGIHIHRELSGIRSFDNEEILDARDFLVDGGGLVMKCLDGKIRRVPYALPFVNPVIRASVSDSRKFSRDIWAFNLEIAERNQDRSLATSCRHYLELLS